MSTVWIRHPDTEAVVEVPETALPIYRQSNWELLPDDAAVQVEQAGADEAAAADRAMTEAGIAAIPPENRLDAPTDSTVAAQAEGMSE